MKTPDFYQQYCFRTLILTTLLSAFFLWSNGQTKVTKDNTFYRKIETLKPEMSKEEVKEIMGEPYKISFYINDKQELVEDMFYKTNIAFEKWYVITYQCIFVSKKLKSLVQKEMIYDTQNIQIENK
jgi:hypothetical protein